MTGEQTFQTGAGQAPTTQAPAAGKPGRKPKPPYVAMDMTQPVAAVVTQHKTGPKVELFPDPGAAKERARELAAKGIDAATFGPQTMLFRKQLSPVEEVDFGANAAKQAAEPAA